MGILFKVPDGEAIRAHHRLDIATEIVAFRGVPQADGGPRLSVHWGPISIMYEVSDLHK